MWERCNIYFCINLNVPNISVPSVDVAHTLLRLNLNVMYSYIEVYLITIRKCLSFFSLNIFEISISLCKTSSGLNIICLWLSRIVPLVRSENVQKSPKLKAIFVLSLKVVIIYHASLFSMLYISHAEMQFEYLDILYDMDSLNCFLFSILGYIAWLEVVHVFIGALTESVQSLCVTPNTVSQ